MPRSDASLDSQSDLSYSDSEDDHLAQQEWEESMQELQQLALVLLLPWVGKFLGRKTSYWRKSCITRLSSWLNASSVFNRYQRVGFGRTFFFGEAPLFSR